MYLKSITSLSAPAIEPVSMDEAFAFCRVDNTDEAVILEGMIAAARETVENFTGRALISQQFVLTVPSWWAAYRTGDRSGELLTVGTNTQAANNILAWYPNARRTDWNVIYLDRSPLLSVDSVKYYDSSETLVTMDPSLYYVLLKGEPGAMVLKATSSWPDVFDRPDAVQITFTAGHGTVSTSVPAVLRSAVLLFVKHLYDNRDAFTIGNGSAIELPWGIKHLLESKRVDGWVS